MHTERRTMHVARGKARPLLARESNCLWSSCHLSCMPMCCHWHVADTLKTQRFARAGCTW